MINSNTQYGRLKKVIIGNELNVTKRSFDLTMKYFYKENLGEKIYEHPMDNYKIKYKYLQERIEDLKNFKNTLESFGIEVFQPEKLRPKKFSTPYFESELSAASNVRDLTFIFQNKIIETPVFVRNRYFENMQLKDYLMKNFMENIKLNIPVQWIKSPSNKLIEDTIDLQDWNAPRDFKNFDTLKYDMAIDAAQFIKINEKECFVNISTYNHYLGYLWVKSNFPDVIFYPFYQLIDNHLDGAFNILDEGKFLVNPKYQNLKEIMPEKFKKWDYIYPENTTRKYPKNRLSINALLASERGMDINVLSISPTQVLVSDDAIETIKILEKNKFEVIPIKLRHSEIFAGGIHCSTLDVEREN